ncbi:acetate--CoA ligase family protein, partial [Nonomuraea lactucae]|uniref:acetate--CoA ligase family protein n=1 Tax=Nonomuraea lactucae TaxID=2249762 RepID=UPI00196244C9
DPPARPAPLLDEALVAELFTTGGTLTEAAGGRVLDALGVARPRAILATTEQEAIAAAAELGDRPLVFKIQSPQIPHKSDVGGVRVGVDPGDAAQAFQEIRAAGDRVPGARVEGVLVQALARPGTELILGVQGARDGYPPVLTVGIGGVATEIYADVASALAPLTPVRALELLRRLRGWPLLDGYRGRPRAAVDAVVAALVALSEAALALGERLDELEINPLAVDEHGVMALDLLIRSRGRGEDA